MVAPIFSPCAIRASLVYVAFLYNALTNISMPLSETQLLNACPPPTDTFACVFSAMNASGAMSKYHYDMGARSAHYSFVGIDNPHRICDALDGNSTFCCLLKALDAGPVVASNLCGYIISAWSDNETRGITTVGFDGYHVFDMTNSSDADFISMFGSELWTTKVYDRIQMAPHSDSNSDTQNYVSPSEGAKKAGVSSTTKLLITITSLVGIIMSALGTKWGIKYSAKCKQPSTDATRYLS